MMNAAKKTAAKKTVKSTIKYTQEQVSGMLANSCMWQEQLRTAAVQQGFKGASVVPMVEIIQFLRNK